MWVWKRFSGVQTGQAISMNPAVSTLADGLARSVGFKDMDTAPIILGACGLEPMALSPALQSHDASPAQQARRLACSRTCEERWHRD